MYLITYVLVIFFRSLLKGKTFSKELCVECYKEFLSSKSPQKKGWLQVFWEVNSLCKYWRTFPDTYFIFCHYLKSVTSMEFMRSFLPQPAYSRIGMGGVENSDYRVLINDKILFHEFASIYGIPTPEMLVVYKNNRWFISNREVSDIDVDKFLGSFEDNRIFLKLASEGAARGVYALKRISGKWTIDGQPIGAIAIRARFEGKSFFFERQIKQEKFLKSFNPDTVNTVRVLTLNNGKEMQIVSAAVRFGRKGAFVDNMHAGGLAVSIDIETGRMESFAGRRFDEKKYYEHPDSHIRFEGEEIPYWKEIEQLVYFCLNILPQYRSIGFDIVTTDKGPIVLEVNTGAGMDLAQVGKNEGIASRFGNYINIARKQNVCYENSI